MAPPRVISFPFHYLTITANFGYVNLENSKDENRFQCQIHFDEAGKKIENQHRDTHIWDMCWYF